MLANLENEFDMTAKTFEGLEEVLANELNELGAKNVLVKKRAVYFSGDKKLMYKANYGLRTALNILVPIHNFKAISDVDFYKGISEISWNKLFGVNDTFAINSTVNSTFFNHSKFIVLRAKDAIVDQFKRREGIRPNIDTLDPKIKINIHIYNDQVTVSLDSSGEPLYKRGYRVNGYIAPINEVLAAGMILISGWKADSDFIDPMCGSGTILIEAALIANNIPPGIYRKEFGFENWNDFDADLLSEVADSFEENGVFNHSIIGFDNSDTAVELARENIKNASLENKIKVAFSDFENLKPENKSGIIIMNPPYGERIKKEDMANFYSMIGNQLKGKFHGFNAWIISSNAEAFKSVGLHASQRVKLYNGPLECRFNKYSIFEGSLKEKKKTDNS